VLCEPGVHRPAGSKAGGAINARRIAGGAAPATTIPVVRMTLEGDASMLGSRRSGGAGHRIGAGAVFEGTLRFSGRLEIEGTVSGQVVADAAEGSEVVVAGSGRVQGQISAATVVIAGTVEGPVRSSARLDVLAGARVSGDLTYRDLQIQHGAVVTGSLKPIEGEQVALKLVANSRT
jgi:cytoskeletal protein CcmA (bactofilin family)